MGLTDMYSHSAVYQGGAGTLPCFGMYTKQLTPPSPYRKVRGGGDFYLCPIYLKPTITLIGIHVKNTKSQILY